MMHLTTMRMLNTDKKYLKQTPCDENLKEDYLVDVVTHHSTAKLEQIDLSLIWLLLEFLIPSPLLSWTSCH